MSKLNKRIPWPRWAFRASAFALLGLSFQAQAELAPEGAITTLMVQAKDPKAYIEGLAANTALFEALGSQAAGYCLTRTGNDYGGQLFVWNAYGSLGDAMASAATYDPYAAPAATAAQRSVKYSALFKPLKAFELKPGYERLWRLEVGPEDLSAFLDAITELEAAIQAAGHDFQAAVFNSAGGGREEAGVIHLRAISPSARAAGAVMDDYYSGAAWAPLWDKAYGYVRAVRSDTFEECAIFYTAP